MAKLYEPRDSPRLTHAEFLINLWLPANRENRSNPETKNRMRFCLQRAREIRNEIGLGNLPA